MYKKFDEQNFESFLNEINKIEEEINYFDLSPASAEEEFEEEESTESLSEIFNFELDSWAKHVMAQNGFGDGT